MKVLVTGAKGFLGKNLCAQLENLRTGKAGGGTVTVDEIYEYDLDTPRELLLQFCQSCDFVFHLAGINRPKDTKEYMEGNCGFTDQVLSALRQAGNSCPVLFSSSIQAALDNPYGASKRAGEELLRAYGAETGAEVLIYRFPNLFGKWCRPNYNSAVATFCHNIARDLPISVNDPERLMELAYVDDVVEELISALAGKPHREGAFCTVPTVYRIRLGAVADLLRSFRRTRTDLSLPDLSDPFAAKLYAAYLSYLPEDGFSYPLAAHEDHRGSFTEVLRTPDRGQISVNVSHPGIVKGNHWHHTKNEKFLVVSGRGVIRFRQVGQSQVYEYHVSGDRPEVVDIPPGYTHQIENLGERDMVTLMWASECFDPDRPDTYFMEV